MIDVTIDGVITEARADERLVDLINRTGGTLAQVCYHPQLGPIQTCDTCMVEVDGALQRACATVVSPGMRVATASERASAAQREAFDRILGNHLLYCTVCDNNNGNCTVHNTTKLLGVEHQETPFRAKPYEVDDTNPFYRYDPDQCILCGRCVEACQNLQGQRDALHQLGGPASARALGRRLDRSANRAAYLAVTASRCARATR